MSLCMIVSDCRQVLKTLFPFSVVKFMDVFFLLYPIIGIERANITCRATEAPVADLRAVNAKLISLCSYVAYFFLLFFVYVFAGLKSPMYWFSAPVPENRTCGMFTHTPCSTHRHVWLIYCHLEMLFCAIQDFVRCCRQEVASESFREITALLKSSLISSVYEIAFENK